MALNSFVQKLKNCQLYLFDNILQTKNQINSCFVVLVQKRRDLLQLSYCRDCLNNFVIFNNDKLLKPVMKHEL